MRNLTVRLTALAALLPLLTLPAPLEAGADTVPGAPGCPILPADNVWHADISSLPVLAKAKAIYQIDCAMCHGDNGNGKTDLGRDMQLALPDWTKPAELAGKPDQALFSTIRNGKDKMPAEAEGRASDNDVWNLIIYIRAMSKGQ